MSKTITEKQTLIESIKNNKERLKDIDGLSIHFTTRQLKQLKQIITEMSTIITRKNKKPILDNILFTGNFYSNDLILTATNLDITYNASVDCDISLNNDVVKQHLYFEFLLPYKQTKTIIKNFKNELHLHMNNSIWEIENLKIQPSECNVDEFPENKCSITGKNIKTDTISIRNAIDLSLLYISKEMSRYATENILLHIKPNEFNIVATNGKALSLNTIPCRIEESLPEQRLLILEDVGILISRILDKEKTPNTFDIYIENLVASIDATRLIFITKNKEIITREREGKFPPYEVIIPPSHYAIKIKSKDLQKSITNLLPIKPEKTMFNFNKKTLDLHSINMQMGEASESIKYYNQEIEEDKFVSNIHINIDYIMKTKKMSIFKNTLPEIITIEYKGMDKAIIIKFSQHGLNTSIIIMPIYY